MPIIASEHCDYGETDGSATYKVEMQDFLAKQRTTKWGVSVRTQPFTVSWSSFNFEIYVSGISPGFSKVVIKLLNNETWAVKVKVSLCIPEVTEITFGPVVMLRPTSSDIVGSIDPSTFVTCFLDEYGTLTLHLKVQVVDEMVSGGTSRILKKLDAVTEELQDTKGRLSSLHSRLNVMDARFSSFVEQWKVGNYFFRLLQSFNSLFI